MISKFAIDWQGLQFTAAELRDLRSAANDVYVAKAVSKEAAWVEAMLALLNRKGYLRIPK